MRIAVLEDDHDQAELLCRWLDAAGYSVTHYDDGDMFLRAVHHDSFDLFVLDWLLPRGSGIGVLKQLRARTPDGPPTLFVTVRDDERCIVDALEAGADDYMIKPVRRAELLARVAALLRRALGTTHKVIEAPPYVLDPDRGLVTMNDERLPLTEKEFELALFLFQRQGQIVSREHLLESVWGRGHAAMNTRTVDTHISRLRKKLRLGETDGWQLSSVYQHGYRLEAPQEATAEAHSL